MNDPELPKDPRLSRPHFFLILGAVVLFFLVGMGPVWAEPFNYYELARSIIWSYVPIPFLVALFLAIARKLTWTSFLVETIVMTVTKFGVTATIMIVIWALAGPPPPNANVPRKPRLLELLPAPRPPPPPPVVAAQAGHVAGHVVDAGGAPVAGALAWLDDVPARAFPVRLDVVTLTNDGTGTHPAVAAVQAGQPLVLRSLDASVHTLQGEQPGGHVVFNKPILPSGGDHALTLPTPVGVVRVRCTVHPDEPESRLIVLPHPFFATTGADGSFAFDEVPAGRVSIVASTASADRRVEIQVAAGEITRLDVQAP